MEDQTLNFTFSWLLLLPVIAAILIFQGTWLDDGKSANGRPKKYQRRLRAKILIHRALIINLLLATFFVYTSSLTILPDIAQGLLLTVILMLPVFAYLLIVVFKWPDNKKTPSTESRKRSSDLEQGRSEQATQTQDAQAENIALAKDTALSESATALSKAEQETIPTTSYSELTDMIASLQNEKVKLQKLVIAQRAVINTEKQRFQKAQALTKNALLVMRRTKEGAQVAIRVARSERHERLRLEVDHANVCRQLENERPARQVKETANY